MKNGELFLASLYFLIKIRLQGGFAPKKKRRSIMIKNRKLTRIIAITLTATVAATSVMPCGTVLGAQNDPVTEEAAETTESVQESEVSESEISEAETSENETESQTGTEAGTEKEINTEINTETGTETEIGMETENDAEIETEIETEQIELES